MSKDPAAAMPALSDGLLGRSLFSPLNELSSLPALLRLPFLLQVAASPTFD